MKKTLFFAMLMAALGAVFTLTSCDDDEEEEIDVQMDDEEEEIDVQMDDESKKFIGGWYTPHAVHGYQIFYSFYSDGSATSKTNVIASFTSGAYITGKWFYDSKSKTLTTTMDNQQYVISSMKAGEMWSGVSLKDGELYIFDDDYHYDPNSIAVRFPNWVTTDGKETISFATGEKVSIGYKDNSTSQEYSGYKDADVCSGSLLDKFGKGNVYVIGNFSGDIYKVDKSQQVYVYNGGYSSFYGYKANKVGSIDMEVTDPYYPNKIRIKLIGDINATLKPKK